MNFKGCSIVTKMIKGFSSPPEVKYTNLSWLMLLDFLSLFFNAFFALFFLHPNCHIQALQSQCFLRKSEGPNKLRSALGYQNQSLVEVEPNLEPQVLIELLCTIVIIIVTASCPSTVFFKQYYVEQYIAPSLSKGFYIRQNLNIVLNILFSN